MDQLYLTHIVILLLQCLLTAGVLLFLFRLRALLGIGLLFAALGVFQYMQVFLANTLYYEIYPGILVSPGSSVLFSASLFMVLLIYIREDAKVLRTLIYALVATNLVLVLLQYSFGYNLDAPNVVNPYNLSPRLFIINARVFLVGTLLLFIDAILIIYLFELVSRYVHSLFLSIFFTMVTVLSIDSVLFSIGGFAGTGQFMNIFISGIISKVATSIFYSGIFTGYLVLFEKEGSRTSNFYLKDIFAPLTYRQKYEQTVIERDEQFRLLYENSPEMLISISPKNGQIILCNKAYLKKTGYTREEVIGQPIFKFYHPDCLPNVKKAFTEFKEKGIVRDVELVLVRKDGGAVDVNLNADGIRDQSGEILYSMSSLRDITQNKKLDGWKNLNLLALEKTTKGNSLYEIFMDILEGVEELLPNAIASIHLLNEGRQLETVVGSRLEPAQLAFIQQMTLEPDSSPLGRAIYSKQRVVISDVKKNSLCKAYLNKALKHRLMACWTIPILGRENDLVFGVFSLHFSEARHPTDFDLKLIDSVGHLLSVIIEKANSEEELNNYKNHLEELVQKRTLELKEANQELESFSYSVSHDLRAPLTRMDGFSKVLQKNYGNILDEKGKHYLERIRFGSQNMATLIDDMLFLSKITRQEIKKESVNIGRLAEETLTQLQASEPEQNVSWTIQKDIIVQADPRLADAMIENLLQNAWKFSKMKASPYIEIGKTERNGEIWYFIKDNGIGFDMKYADQLFQPFRRLHSSNEVEGNGIGLATVKRIVNKHGGQIEAEGQEGKGAVFYFKL